MTQHAPGHTSSHDVARTLRELALSAPGVLLRQTSAGEELYRVPRTAATATLEFRVYPNGELDWRAGSERSLFYALLGHFGRQCDVHATYSLTLTSLSQEAFSLTLATPAGQRTIKVKRPLQVLLDYLAANFTAAGRTGAPAQDANTDDDDSDILLID